MYEKLTLQMFHDFVDRRVCREMGMGFGHHGFVDNEKYNDAYQRAETVREFSDKIIRYLFENCWCE